MKLGQRIKIGFNVLCALTLKRKKPLVVGWNITYRCNLDCDYCGYPSRKTEELDASEAKLLIDQLASLGTKILVLSGGEPLLRDDIGVLIDHCRQKGIYTAIYTNGLLLKKRFDEIKNINEIQLSLDGPKDINDTVRGKGVFDKVIEALELCQRHNIKTSLSTVISKYNTDTLEQMFDIAKQYNTKIMFQPVGKRFSGDTDNFYDHPKESGPNEQDYQNAINYLINEKLRGNPYINNSLSGLNHFLSCSHISKMKCIAHLISCSIEPDGKVFTCDMFPHYQNYLVEGLHSFKESFNGLALPHTCEGYCNGNMLEVNLINNFRFGAMFKMWGRYKFNINQKPKTENPLPEFKYSNQ